MLLQPVDCQALFSPRVGEHRLGEVLAQLSPCDDLQSYQHALAQAWNQGQRILLVGVPESIGPRANLGRGGAEHGWQAALKGLLNLQANELVASDLLLLAGSVVTDDLQQASADLDPQDSAQLEQLRDLCAQLDERVSAVLQPAFAQGFAVILIGGGHNNAYPLLTSLAEATEHQVGAINLDPHADFRACEGRHSGNGFSYAYEHGALGHYHVVGLHPAKNNARSIQRLQQAGFGWVTLQQLWQQPWAEQLLALKQLSDNWHCPFGIEIDVDALYAVPASAINFIGLSVSHAATLVSSLASHRNARYLHLAEAAPSLHPQGQSSGDIVTAQLLSELVLAYLEGFCRRVP
ncbi:formimidoylglutamase [Pseudidiomarina mangrovi]|uniref:formimidoylglutamase n=1 Tax=Pseudidiomarina mangrovi TaxID=2487133 RepID=UPI000FCB47D1|nr:formimidoylglutamase [Pseudidiomarina mangrovi]